MRWNQIVLILVLAVVAMVVLQIPKLQQRQPTVKYEYWTQFLEEWNAGEVDTVRISTSQERASGKLKDGTRYTVKAPPDPQLWDKLLAHNPGGGKLAAESSAWTDKAIRIAGSFLLPLMLIYVFWRLMVKQMQAGSGQALGLGRSRHERPMTAEELAKLPDNGMRRELVRGEVIEMAPSGAERSAIGAHAVAALVQLANETETGTAFGADCGFILAEDPDVVRVPDASFVLRRRLTQGRPPEGFFPGPPDLAVEVVSPTDQAADVQEKVNDYLKAGTSLVWVIYPSLRQVRVHKSLAESFTVEEDGTLKGDPILPDLSIPVKEIFAQ